jgi:hypothetical protein
VSLFGIKRACASTRMIHSEKWIWMFYAMLLNFMGDLYDLGFFSFLLCLNFKWNFFKKIYLEK